MAHIKTREVVGGILHACNILFFMDKLHFQQEYKLVAPGIFESDLFEIHMRVSY